MTQLSNNIGFTSRYIVYGNNEDRHKAVSTIKDCLFVNNIDYSYFYPLDIYEKKPVDQIMICTNDENGNDADKCRKVNGLMQQYVDIKNKIMKTITKSYKDKPELLKQFLEKFQPPVPEKVNEFLNAPPRFDIDLKPELEASNINRGFLKKSFNPVDGKFYQEGSQNYVETLS